MKRKIFLLMSILAITLFACAQKHCTISGIIKDTNNTPVEGAVVWLSHAGDSSPITQGVTDEDGKYEIPCVSGSFNISVTCLGYSSYTGEKSYATNETILPPISLEMTSKTLSDVVVVADRSRPLIELKTGKIVFNVENSISAQGSNAFEILKLTLGVIIDGKNSISLNGRGGVLVMLNGKQTYMEQSDVVDLLRSTSAADIKTIEVISNATAQYDAQGSGGILNIVLKKNMNDGFNMSVSSGLSYWTWVRNNTEFSFNYRKGKVNLYGSYSHRFGSYYYGYGSDRIQSGKRFNSDSYDRDRRNFITPRLGVDYDINDKHTIGAGMNGNIMFGPGGIDTKIDIWDWDKQEKLYSMRSISDFYHQNFERLNTNVYYRFEDKNNRSVTVDFDYGTFDGYTKINQPNEYYSLAGALDSTHNYRSVARRDINLYAFSANYKQPLWKGDVMVGAKYSTVASENNFKYYKVLDPHEELNTDRSNLFNFDEKIASAYLQYDMSFGDKLTANAGLRFEHTSSVGHLTPVAGSTQKESKVNRYYNDLFPSVSITYMPKEKHSISLGYGRRIDRPVYSDMNPIEEALDGFTVWKGNPFLLPQKTNRIALQYGYDKTVVEFYFTHTQDYRVSIIDTVGVDRIEQVPRNIGEQNTYGMSVTQSFRPLSGWDVNLSGRVHRAENKVEFDKTRDYDRRRWSATISARSLFPIIWGIKGEIFGIYVTRRLGGSTEVMKETSQVDFSIQKKYLNEKLAVKLGINDIFWKSNWDNYNSFDGLQSLSYGRHESREVKLNVSYIFERGKARQRNKSSNVESELDRF